MKNGHKYLLLLLLPLLAGGCTLTESRDTEINQKPTLEMQLPVDARFKSLDVLVYDPQGLFFNQVRFVDGVAVSADRFVREVAGTKADGGKFELLAGVPEGDYQVITYANLDRATIPTGLQHGVSQIGELVVGLDATGNYDQTDSVYHHIASYTVRRGDPAQGQMALKPRYYHVDMTVRMEDGHPDPVTDFSVVLDRVPGSYNSHGAVRNDMLCTVVPQVTANTENTQYTAQFPLHRFTDDHAVELVVSRRGVLFGAVQVLPSVIGVDPEHPDEVILTIDFMIEADKIMVKINEWDAVIVQQTEVGS